MWGEEVNMLSVIKNLVLGGSLLMAGTAVSAATISTSYQESSVFGTPNLSRSVQIESSGYDGWAAAGPFRLTGSDGFGDFVAFCIDLAQYMANGVDYDVHDDSWFSDVVEQRLVQLFNFAYDSLTTRDQGAAFQVAIWEIVEDGDSLLDLDDGSFQLLSADVGVRSFADSYLIGLQSASTSGQNLTFLKSDTRQDLVTVSPVPVPAAGGLLVMALAVFSVVSRRKRSKAA